MKTFGRPYGTWAAFLAECGTRFLPDVADGSFQIWTAALAGSGRTLSPDVVGFS
ncbi:MAG: hypothetical protein LBQ15_03810 [Clostridium sp.]|nr:hypothetical protein [Clostridium sp.]